MAASFTVCLKDKPMVNQRTFGRRASAQPARAPVTVEAIKQTAKIDEVPVEQVSLHEAQSPGPSVDHELEEWKRARRQAFRIPWRQLSLVASLCFGIASFVLPDTVNDNVQWLLYALMAASLFAGFSRRREAKSRA